MYFRINLMRLPASDFPQLYLITTGQPVH